MRERDKEWTQGVKGESESGEIPTLIKLSNFIAFKLIPEEHRAYV